MDITSRAAVHSEPCRRHTDEIKKCPPRAKGVRENKRTWHPSRASAPCFAISSSFRIFHPKLSAGRICARLRMRPIVAWTDGDPSVALNGQALCGVRKGSYCCFSLTARKGEWPADFMQRHLRTLEKRGRFFASIARTGGLVDYYLSCKSSGAVGIDLTPELMRSLSRMQVHFAVDGFESFPGSELVR